MARIKIDNGVTYVSNSMLCSVASCGRQAAVRHLLGLTIGTESVYLRAGSAVHKAIELYWKGEGIDAAMDGFKSEYYTYCQENVPDDDRLGYTNVERVMLHYFETHPIHSYPFTIIPDFVEVKIAQALSDDVVLVGQIDAIVEMNGAYYILDHKSTGSLTSTWAKKFRVSPQLTGYVWAAREQLDLPVVGAFINGIELRKVPGSTRKCPEHGVKYEECGILHCNTQIVGPISRHDGQIERWREMAISQARKLRDLVNNIFPDPSVLYADDFDPMAYLDAAERCEAQGMLNGSCTMCELYDLCASGANINVAAGELTESSYDPYKGIV